MNKFVVVTCMSDDSETVNKNAFQNALTEVFKKNKKELTVINLNLIEPDILDKFIEMGSFDCIAFTPEMMKKESGKKLITKVLKSDKGNNKSTQFVNVYNGENKENIDYSVSLGNLLLENNFNCNLNHIDLSQDERIICQNIIGMKNSALKTRQRLQEKDNDVVDLTLKIVNKIETQKDEYTAVHMRSVTTIARAISEKLGLSEDEIEVLKIGALLHDVGKQDISDNILKKPTRLEPDEYAKMQQHVTLGEIELNEYNLGKYERAKVIAAEHHERYDGKGYPRGLKGEEIDILSRIVSIADATQAMFGRSYASGKTKEQLIDILNENAGTQFDPELVNVLSDILEKEPEKINVKYTEEGKIIYDAPTAEETLSQKATDREKRKALTFLDKISEGVKSEEDIDLSYREENTKRINDTYKSLE